MKNLLQFWKRKINMGRWKKIKKRKWKIWNYEIEYCKIKDLKQKLNEKQSKIIEHFMSSKKFIFFLCMYKMYLISAEGYKNAEVDAKIVRKTGEIWVSMKDVGSGVGVKNI